MSQTNLLSSVLFRDSRLVDTLPLGACLLRSFEEHQSDVLHEVDNHEAQMVIEKGEGHYTLRLSPEGIESFPLRRMLNPVLKSVIGEILTSEDGMFLILKTDNPSLRTLVGSQREMFIPSGCELRVTLDKAVTKVLEIEIAPMQDYFFVQ